MSSVADMIQRALRQRREILNAGRNPEDGWFICTPDEAAAYYSHMHIPVSDHPHTRIAGLHLVIGEPDSAGEKHAE